MKKGYVSIVTPCYNGEKYLSNLLNSILEQSYKKIEFILINDGSTDGTEKVAKEYEKKFKKCNIDFKYIVQKNAGQAAAVDKGLKVVAGEYFMKLILMTIFLIMLLKIWCLF